MSAYILLAANSSANNAHRKQLEKRRRVKKSGHSQYDPSTTSESIRRYSTYSSLHSSGSRSSSDRKKVYDVNSNAYVDRSMLMTTTEKLLSQYDSQYEAIKNASKYQWLNEKLNHCHLDTSIDDSLLLTEKHLNLLRYSYFKTFTHDYDLILRNMNSTDSNNQPSLKYLRKIEKLRRAKNKISHESIQTSDDDDDTKEEDEDVKMAHFAKCLNINDERAIFQEYSTFKANLDNGAKSNIRSLMKSNNFWNNIYQDIKFNYIQLKHSYNYFDYLPRIEFTMNFFGELFDLFLYNIKMLKINIPNNLRLKNEDADFLQKFTFFYFDNHNYEKIIEMSHRHLKTYQTQSTMNNTLNSPISLSFNLDRKDSVQQDLNIHKDLMNKLIETLIDNLKNSLNLPDRIYQHNENNKLFKLWESFLRLVIFDLLVDEKYYLQQFNNETNEEDDVLPAPTIDYEDDDYDSCLSPSSSTFDFTSPMQINPSSWASSPIQSRSSIISSNTNKLKIMRNSSVSSRSTTPSSIMSSPKQRNKNSVASTISSYSYAQPNIGLGISHEAEVSTPTTPEDRSTNHHDIVGYPSSKPSPPQSQKTFKLGSKSSSPSMTTNKSRKSIFGKFRKQ
ncbi:hypothetical protein HYPBUDRAFT_168651 [Hyphopichia burtonii NRRL Y-1933]|uniref:Uncharacterized protein n=1 Tax=Hyphopichia burtonii NRRL Y-1933 TaxID=984485 RepID=A0A1E4RD52_9ASCO|nr:hypothetical protein HYPBUDRAFT_168651 [Hyphopichia burtonii NRRL Y-1933]ODV65199.1 hypothetical protein HYPBUDRAFT_168651 [Hyphopichia burtonii NRRL Y-1933]